MIIDTLLHVEIKYYSSGLNVNAVELIADVHIKDEYVDNMININT